MKGLQTRMLGQTTVEIGALGLGTWALSGPWDSPRKCALPPWIAPGYVPQDDAQSAKVLVGSFDGDVRLIDTANLYGAGQAERLVGEAIRGRGHKAFVSTRFRDSYDPSRTVLIGSDRSPAAIRATFKASIRNLASLGFDPLTADQMTKIDVIFDRASNPAELIPQPFRPAT